jgi:hypothetical protein
MQAPREDIAVAVVIHPENLIAILPRTTAK